jgi:hypothetical protein
MKKKDLIESLMLVGDDDTIIYKELAEGIEVEVQQVEINTQPLPLKIVIK